MKLSDRLSRCESVLSVELKDPHFVFFTPAGKDTETLLTAKSVGNGQSWERQSDEDFEAFKDRIKADCIAHDITKACFIIDFCLIDRD
jgi:hypothetical protein